MGVGGALRGLRWPRPGDNQTPPPRRRPSPGPAGRAGARLAARDTLAGRPGSGRGPCAGRLPALVRARQPPLEPDVLT